MKNKLPFEIIIMSILGMITALLIGLKKFDVIDWSWWAVLSPSLIPIGISTLVFMGVGIAFFLFGADYINDYPDCDDSYYDNSHSCCDDDSCDDCFDCKGCLDHDNCWTGL